MRFIKRHLLSVLLGTQESWLVILVNFKKWSVKLANILGILIPVFMQYVGFRLFQFVQVKTIKPVSCRLLILDISSVAIKYLMTAL